ncbi:MAG: hypothetical protein JOZ98_09195, partial [Solirubrobacterales bacterium]|nr:hypothetical protein [Solirubrobacterales bacterium]
MRQSLIGLAAATDSTTREFSGRLGLLSGLEALLPSAADDPHNGELAGFEQLRKYRDLYGDAPV